MQHSSDACGVDSSPPITQKRKDLAADSPRDYANLLISNRNYRLYVSSHICQHCGDWFVRIASLLAIQHIAPGSNTAISMLVVMKTLPEIILSPIGGILADSFDRRKLMIGLDLLASFIVLGYVVAVRAQSVELLYTVQFLRATIQAMYEPVTKSIVPLIVSAEELKIAVTLHGMIWSIMLMVGGVVAGYASAALGLETCFIIDTVTYVISAFVMMNVQGNFGVCKSLSTLNHDVQKDTLKKTPVQRMRTNILQALRPIRSFYAFMKDILFYLYSCGFGLLILMKASGTLTWASADVLNASISEVDGNEVLTSRRMGDVFSCIGIGCLLGPLVVNNTVVKAGRPETMQRACIIGLGIASCGWLGIAHSNSFSLFCFFTVIRAFGSAIIWVDSTLLLQNLAVSEKLGRVLGYEYSIAMFAEAVCVYITGIMEDRGFGRYEVAMISSIIGLGLMAFWSVYDLFGYGARKQLKDFAPYSGLQSSNSNAVV